MASVNLNPQELPASPLIPCDTKNFSSYHWGSFVPSSPKMQQMKAEYEALHQGSKSPQSVSVEMARL